ncbi:MAG TPA: peptidase [Natronosporangium sp.]|nr:peptidase [Natronosporangium sp.]
MSRTPRLATVLAVAALVVTAGASGAAAAPAADVTPGAVVRSAAVTAAEQQAVLEYWTPERMAAAVPIEQLAGDVLARLPRTGTPAAGAPMVVEPTPAADLTDAGITAFPHPGGPWTGGGLVTSTAGRVFFTYQGRQASCSGNAVTSANGSVVMTAGHCIKLDGAYHTNWMFVPGYDHGSEPYGRWTARQVFVTPQWHSMENINYDIGAAVVNLQNGNRLTDVVGGQGVAFNQSRGVAMYAFGYPAASPYDGSRLIYCSGNTFNDPLFSTAIGMNCNMTGGSSGGPWFRNFNEATGAGIQNSVNSFGYTFFPNVMFGPYFGTDGQNVYQNAQAA